MNLKRTGKNILVKQTQRNRIFYMVVQPIIGMVQLVIWFYIWIGMPVDLGMIIMIVGFPILQIVVWAADKSGFFQSWRAQESKSMSAVVTDAQINLQGARWANFQELTREQRDKIIVKSKAVLGITEDEIF